MNGKTEDNRTRRDRPSTKTKQEQDLVGFVNSPTMISQIARALPSHITADRLARIVTTAMRKTTNLAKCDTLSTMGCVLQLAVCGLEPNTPLNHAYLIPRAVRNRPGEYECTYMIGYPGMIDIAMRSGRITSMTSRAVYDGDDFVYSDGLRPVLSHSWRADGKLTDLRFVYAVARMRDAEPQFEVLTLEMIYARRARSDAYKNYLSKKAKFGKATEPPWVTDFVVMARKSGIRALWPWIPKSVEYASLVAHEDRTDGGGTSRALDIYTDQVASALQTVGLDQIAESTVDVAATDTVDTLREFDQLKADHPELAEQIDAAVNAAPTLDDAVDSVATIIATATPNESQTPKET